MVMVISLVISIGGAIFARPLVKLVAMGFARKTLEMAVNFFWNMGIGRSIGDRFCSLDIYTITISYEKRFSFWRKTGFF
jgi:hypothetical protein